MSACYSKVWIQVKRRGENYYERQNCVLHPFTHYAMEILRQKIVGKVWIEV